MPADDAAQKRLQAEETAAELRLAEAAVYRVPAEELGAYDAQRTLLKRKVLPGHIANCVTAIASDEFSHTTGPLVPIDAGVVAFPGRLR